MSSVVCSYGDMTSSLDQKKKKKSPTVAHGVHLQFGTSGSLARVEVTLLLLGLVLATEEGDISRGGLHGSNFGFLSASADDVDEIISSDFVIREVCNGLFEMIRETGANEDGNIGIRETVSSKFAKKTVVLAFSRHEVFKFCCFVIVDIDDRGEMEGDTRLRSGFEQLL